MIVHIDMDDTLCNYTHAYQQSLREFPDLKYPQSRQGFFLELEPIENAVTAVNELIDSGIDIHILTAPSVKNPNCYSEKRIWIENHFGLDLCCNLIIARNKALVLGDYLIDDNITGRGQDQFSGRVIHFGSPQFPDWLSVTDFFSSVVSSD